MKQILSILLFIGITLPLYGTHNRAGEIIYRLISNLSYEVTIITYTKESSTQADRDSLEIFWGDGTSSILPRVNGPIIGGNHKGVSLGNDIKMNEYKGVHTYAGPQPFYVISMADPNRIADIININGGNSVSIQFYIEDTLRIYPPADFGFNNSPVLLTPPIDYANVNDTFYHNPNAYDPDGDSLHFSLITPRQSQGSPVPQYKYPDEILPGPNNVFTINPRTGEIIWAVPPQKGIYNIAILVREYREGLHMGSLVRDMQIIVLDEPNDPPRISRLNDTCIVAGNLLERVVTARDPDPGQQVTLLAQGGPFEVAVSPASFPPVTGSGVVSQTFRWQTVCEHIRRQFYEVVFKAEDNYRNQSNISLPLVDLETWLIKVVAPPPENVTATPSGNQINISWDMDYPCESIAKFTGFSVWRREGSNPFTIDTCQPGLAGRGYTKIASNVMGYSFTDMNVSRGKTYCYRVLAEFAGVISPSGNYFNVIESLPSNEACTELRRDVPVILNVSVTQTDAVNGKMFIRWTKPRTDSLNFDTLQFPGPYRFELYRSQGFGMNNPQLLYSTSAAAFSGLNDTTFNDSTLNTSDFPYSYRVDFYANGNVFIGSAETASSVRLSINATDRQLDLSWQALVPWNNYTYHVFRYNPGTSSWDSIATTSLPRYKDSGLKNDSLYCYYIRAIGSYSASGIPSPLINLSQQACARPVDTIPPCPPVLTVTNPCQAIPEKENCEITIGDFVNTLKWQNQNVSCSGDIVRYKIYYSPPLESSFYLIDSLNSRYDTVYHHLLDNNLAGCYYVTAVDSYQNESGYHEIVCVDNCPCYLLPNVFTPNNDGKNDLFVPMKPYRFIASIDMKIYNRWGNLVYQTTDPEINWDGRDIHSGKLLDEGVYYYHCTVYELRQQGILPAPEVLTGYIHLIKGK